MRVLDAEGKQVGVLTKEEALRMAHEQELDLVEIAPLAKPPVVKIIDYNKFLYQMDKKKREEKRKAKVSETKELRMGPFISGHDLEVRVRQARGFLEDGDKVRLVVRFRGRQITHPEIGRQLIQKIVESLNDVSKVDREAHFEGKQLVALLSVEKGKKHNESEEKN